MAPNKKSAPKKTARKKPAKNALHYNKQAVVEGYSKTFQMVMVATGVSVGFIFLYFMVFVVYLGGASHSKHDPFYEKFNDRIDLSSGYDGQPLPQYEQK